jgi:hypothetical protein
MTTDNEVEDMRCINPDAWNEGRGGRCERESRTGYDLCDECGEEAMETWLADCAEEEASNGY